MEHPFRPQLEEGYLDGLGSVRTDAQCSGMREGFDHQPPDADAKQLWPTRPHGMQFLVTMSAVSLSHMQGTWMFMSVKVQDADPHLHTVQDDLEALFWVGVYMIILYMPIPRANAIAIVDDVFLSHSFVDGIPTGGNGKAVFLWGSAKYSLRLPDTVSPALVSWVKSYNQLIFDRVSYLNKLERHSLDPLLDDAPAAPTDLVDYDKLDQIWRRILDQGVFEANDRLNDRDHKRDPFHVTAVYRKSVAKEADGQVELQASARFTLAESQRAEAQARRAEMQRGNPKASIELGLSQNSGADASHSNTLLERSAALNEGGEGVDNVGGSSSRSREVPAREGGSVEGGRGLGRSGRVA